jgi:hypothetical protein
MSQHDTRGRVKQIISYAVVDSAGKILSVDETPELKRLREQLAQQVVELQQLKAALASAAAPEDVVAELKSLHMQLANQAIELQRLREFKSATEAKSAEDKNAKVDA